VRHGEHGKPFYCLVSELAERGDILSHMKKNPVPWTEARARREIMRLLRALTLLHLGGAVHRDATPSNIFLTGEGTLKLGDFGIARHPVGNQEVPADFFNRSFAPEAIADRKLRTWLPADDVFHMGQLFALLLSGRPKGRFTTRDVKGLKCGPQAKAVIQRSIGPRRKRFADASRMLEGMKKQEESAALDRVRSLEGRRVVFTGRLSVTRNEARKLLIAAGGKFEKGVTGQTDVVVLGDDSPFWKAGKKGQKLLDVDHQRELGHRIAVIQERRFLALVHRYKK